MIASMERAIDRVRSRTGYAECSPRQREFALRYAAYPGSSATEIMRSLGYRDGPGLHSQASRMLRNDKVQKLVTLVWRELAMAHAEALARLSEQARGDWPTKVQTTSAGTVVTFDMLEACRTLTQIGNLR